MDERDLFAAEGAAPAPGAPAEDPAPRCPALPKWRMTVGWCLLVLVPGLLPVVGILTGLVWGYGPDGPHWRRTLARALLVLHGAALALLVAGLAVWVLALLAGRPVL